MAEYTPDYVEHVDHPAVKEFAEAARNVCNVFERLDDLAEIEFLRQLEELTSLAYSLAHRMPNLFGGEDDGDEEDEEHEEDYESVRRPWPRAMSEKEHMALWQDLHQRIGEKLGPHSHIAWVFDPANPDGPEVVDGELAYLLASLYVDLKEGLILYDRSSDSERAQGLWDLWFGMKQGWGWKLAQAFLPIHSLVHHHYDAIGEEWWANYNHEETSP